MVQTAQTGPAVSDINVYPQQPGPQNGERGMFKPNNQKRGGRPPPSGPPGVCWEPQQNVIWPQQKRLSYKSMTRPQRTKGSGTLAASLISKPWSSKLLSRAKSRIQRFPENPIGEGQLALIPTGADEEPTLLIQVKGRLMLTHVSEH